MRSIILGLLVSASSAFADAEAYKKEIAVTPLLKTQTDAAGKAIVYPTGSPEVTAVRVEIPSGTQTGWHKHPVPCFAYILEGELHVQIDGGETKILKAGEAYAETVDVMHNGVNQGNVPVKLIMFATGASGQPYAVRPPAPEQTPAAK
ncbi:MAG TPA: cupin domain-containing protein [Luteolibacter sp.]